MWVLAIRKATVSVLLVCFSSHVSASIEPAWAKWAPRLLCAGMIAGFGGREAIRYWGPESQLRAYLPDEDSQCLPCNRAFTHGVQGHLHRAFHIQMTMAYIDPEDEEVREGLDRSFRYLDTLHEGSPRSYYDSGYLSDSIRDHERARSELARLLVELEHQLTVKAQRLRLSSDSEIARFIATEIIRPPSAESDDWKILEARGEYRLISFWTNEFFFIYLHPAVLDYLRNYESVAGTWRLKILENGEPR